VPAAWPLPCQGKVSVMPRGETEARTFARNHARRDAHTCALVCTPVYVCVKLISRPPLTPTPTPSVPGARRAWRLQNARPASVRLFKRSCGFGRKAVLSEWQSPANCSVARAMSFDAMLIARGTWRYNVTTEHDCDARCARSARKARLYGADD